MAMNPMQRKTFNSFLLGLIIGLGCLVAAIIIAYNKIKGLQQDLDALKALQTKAYVAGEDIESGAEVEFSTFKEETVQTTIAKAEFITKNDFEFLDSEGKVETRLDENGTKLKKKMVMKIAVPKGTIITKDMLTEVGDEVRDDERMVEYTMLVLPSRLQTGDYVDIRLALPTGEDYIVLAKKQIKSCNATTVWLKMNEEEVMTLENAIVESYQISGSKLYCLMYTEPGLQAASVTTYPVSDNVRNLIINNPNIVMEAKAALAQKYNQLEQNIQRTDHIEAALARGSTSSVASGINKEVSAIASLRAEFIKNANKAKSSSSSSSSSSSTSTTTKK